MKTSSRKIIVSILLGIAIIFTYCTYLKSLATLNVKDYGAVGDGVTDDTSAIKSALNDGKNRRIYFPEGEYKITGALPVRDYTTLYGANAEIKTSADLATMMEIKGKNISVQNLNINGNKTALRGLTIKEGSHNVDISNNTIQHLTQPKHPELARLTVTGIRIEGGSSKIHIDKNQIHDVMARNPIKGWDHYVARGILISPAYKNQSASKNITISNSEFSKIGPKDDGDGIVVQGFDESVNLEILDNSFAYIYKRAIKIQSPGALIKGNKIYNNFDENNFYQTYSEKKTHDMWAAISVYADDTVIEDNTINGIGNYGRIIDIASASHIKIADNYLKNGGNYKDSSIISITSANAEHAARDLDIFDNVFVNGRYGVYSNSPISNLNVLNNKQVNVTED
jgi:polygalacturonase